MDSTLYETMGLVQHHSSRFRYLWEYGAALSDDPEDVDALVSEAAITLLMCAYIKRHTAFITRLATWNIERKVKKAMVEVALLREATRRMIEYGEGDYRHLTTDAP